jgi:Skp family chaperone for outer membrane proteins
MNRNRLIIAALMLMAMMSISVMAQPRPQTAAPRPTPTPFPRSTPTPLPRPVATPAAVSAAVPESKIALIDTVMFGDEKNGIFVYVDASKKIELEFQPRTNELKNLQTRLNTLANEIKTLMQAKIVDKKTIDARQAEGERLQQEATTKKESLDEDVTRRYQQVVAPISKQIGTALDQFARQRGITMTLDMSKLLPAILTAVPTVDITAAFIADFNSKNPRTGAQRP